MFYLLIGDLTHDVMVEKKDPRWLVQKNSNSLFFIFYHLIGGRTFDVFIEKKDPRWLVDSESWFATDRDLERDLDSRFCHL